MREWNAYVRERLTLTGLRREREVEIVEDLARQLDDAYREAKESGASDVDARARAERHITDWDALSRQLSASPRARLWPAEHWAQQRDDRGLAARGRLSLLSELRQDFLYGLRSLGHHAGLTTIAVISLAIGIGANTALFGVMNALVFRPLPVRDPQQLVVVTDPTQAGIMTGVENGERTLLSVHEFEGLRDHSSAIDGLFAFGANQMIAPVGTSDVGEPRSAPVVLVTGAYFRTLGVGAALGRVFAADIDRAPLGAPEAVVSDAFWRDRLAADPNAVGRTITIRRTAYTVIGVLPPTFTGIVVGEAPDVWLPRHDAAGGRAGIGLAHAGAWRRAPHDVSSRRRAAASGRDARAGRRLGQPDVSSESRRGSAADRGPEPAPRICSTRTSCCGARRADCRRCAASTSSR